MRRKIKQSSVIETLVNSVKEGAATVSRAVRPEQKTVVAEPQEKTAAPPSAPAKSTAAPAAAPAAKPAPVIARNANAKFALYAPEAKRVSLCGEFNAWSPDATPMKPQGNGLWETALVLSPGRYQYKFVADGQWLPDPKAEATPNIYGSVNSVILVQA
jgi:hypothetical protein